MSKYITDAKTLTSLANAIRNKGNISSSISYPVGFINAINSIPTIILNLQSKSITPIESAITITPDNGFDALYRINIDAIPSSYIGTGITRLAGNTYIPSTTNLNIPALRYLTGSQIISGDSNLKASNILEGINIFGINGTATSNAATNRLVSLLNKTITSFEDISISKIREGAFYSCSWLTSVNCPNVTEVGSWAFALCTRLQTLNIKWSALTRINKAAFQSLQYIPSTTVINLPACSYIDDGAFEYVNCLIYAPNCQYIGDKAFYSNSIINSIPTNCLYIGSSAFYRMRNISSISLPYCSYIGDEAFVPFSSSLGCTYVSLPMCLYIGNYAFSNNSTLSFANVGICSYIGRNAFYSCKSLSAVYILASSVVSPPDWGTIFDYTPMVNSTFLGYYGSIYVPASLINSYKVASYWSTLSDRFVGI